MKKTITLLAFVSCGMITMFSCKKSDNPSTPATGSMTATINGAAYNGTKCVLELDDSSLSITGGTADGLFIDAPLVFLGVTNYAGVGTYTIDGVKNIASIDSTGSDSTFTKDAVYGTVNITATTPHITGTFSFTTRDSTKVANGNFTSITE